MSKLELKHITPYLPYKLMCQLMGEVDDSNNPKEFLIDGANTSYIDVWSLKTMTDEWSYEDVFPILHPLSDLTKPITVEGYNEGKEFVPIVEIAEILYQKISWTGKLQLCSITKDRVMFDSYEDINIFRYDEKEQEFYVSFDEEEYPPERQLTIFELLYTWHFDVRHLISQNLAIDINTIQ